MDPKELYKYTSFCWERDIKVLPKPVNNRGLYRIKIERNGRGNTGQLEFLDKPKAGENSVWDQIRLLYKMLYEKELNKNE